MHADWKIIADSVTGSSHARKNLPNQDNGGWYAGKDGYPLIGTVSDGHGGREYLRSDRGSALGVQAALRVLSTLLLRPPFACPLSLEDICKEIVKEWRSDVLSDIRKHPYDPAGQEIIADGRQGQRFNAPLDPDYEQIRPYGSTLLAVVITGEEAIFFQLGDGDIIIHAPDGSFIRPIAPDGTLSGNETYSLCTDESWKDFRIAKLNFIPDFIMLSTDGYANSFLDEEGFFTAARDLYSYIYQAGGFEAGVQVVRSNLRDWLDTTSRKGSGDDITLLILTRDPCPAGSPYQGVSPGRFSLLRPLSSYPQSPGLLSPAGNPGLIRQVPEGEHEYSALNKRQNLGGEEHTHFAQPRKKKSSTRWIPYIFFVLCLCAIGIWGGAWFAQSHQPVHPSGYEEPEVSGPASALPLSSLNISRPDYETGMQQISSYTNYTNQTGKSPVSAARNVSPSRSRHFQAENMTITDNSSGSNRTKPIRGYK